MKTMHPLILKASKVCGKCGYELKGASSKTFTDPHTKEKISTAKAVMVHKSKKVPNDLSTFIATHFNSMSPLNHHHYNNPTGEVSLKIHEKPEGHEIHFHSVKIVK